MLPGDSRQAIDESILKDERVQTFWDPDRIIGDWFAMHPVGGLDSGGYTVWDAYYAFAGKAEWGREPTRAIAAGATIIGNTSRIEQRFQPLLK